MKTSTIFFKNSIVILTIILVCSYASWAQKSAVTGSLFSLNLKGGVNIAQVKTDAGSLSNVINESLATQKGFAFGASARLGRKLFIQPEVLFSQKGGQVKSVVSNIFTGFDMSYTTLDLPVLIGYKLGHFFILGGPVFSNQISQNSGLDQALSSVYSSWKSGEGYKKSTLNYQIGAGVNLLGLTIDVRYETGENIFNTNVLSTITQKPSLIQATVGIKIL